MRESAGASPGVGAVGDVPCSIVWCGTTDVEVGEHLSYEIISDIKAMVSFADMTYGGPGCRWSVFGI